MGSSKQGPGPFDDPPDGLVAAADNQDNSLAFDMDCQGILQGAAQQEQIPGNGADTENTGCQFHRILNHPGV
ncbi:MAG: hypothetical protein U5K27_15030 [Desulfotignum sp.]|nr:hypothetical protein [Desulfotignum sp.]